MYESALDLIGETPMLHLRSFDRPGAASLYAKLEIISIDSAASLMTFRALRNINCTYRDLQVGIPDN